VADQEKNNVAIYINLRQNTLLVKDYLSPKANAKRYLNLLKNLND
jgi:hypothetical protein